MVRTIPADPRLNTGERVVWDRLLAQCGPGDLLVSGQRVTDHVTEFEVDVVLALADGGIVTVEVKGGEVTHDEAQDFADEWWIPLLGGLYVFSDEGQRVFDQHLLGFKAGRTAGLLSSVVLEAGPAGPPGGQKSG